MKGMAGKKHSEESKKKMSIAKLGRHISPSTEFKKGGSRPNEEKRIANIPRGENHYKYNKTNISYLGIHSWIRKVLGKPERCSLCDTKKSKRFMWHNISRMYLRDINDWVGVCAKCHANIHKNWEKRWKKN